MYCFFFYCVLRFDCFVWLNKHRLCRFLVKWWNNAIQRCKLFWLVIDWLSFYYIIRFAVNSWQNNVLIAMFAFTWTHSCYWALAYTRQNRWTSTKQKKSYSEISSSVNKKHFNFEQMLWSKKFHALLLVTRIALFCIFV